jgi:hypothetical protein
MTADRPPAAPPRLAVLALGAFVVFQVMALALVAVRGTNVGFDFQAYARASQRVLDGLPVYDLTVKVAGDFAAFFYPPPFALAFIPFAIVPQAIGLWQWSALGIGSIGAGIAILPIKPRARWIVLALSVIHWPVLYSILLSQVGPLLFLLFAIGWRWRDRPLVLGLTMATGAMIKIQPVILFGWAALTGRWRAVGIGLAAMVAAAVVSTLILGPGVWADFVGLVGRVSSVTTPKSVSVGAVAYQAGVSETAAQLIQLVTMAVVAAVVLVAIVKASPEVSYLTTAVASQLLSPIVWDHYAVVLILPTAWLLDRGQWWAAVLMLATSVPAIAFLPPAVYPVVFGVGLVAPLLVEWMQRAHPAGLRRPWARADMTNPA